MGQRVTLAALWLGMGALAGCGTTEVNRPEVSKSISISAAQTTTPPAESGSSNIPEVRTGERLQFNLNGSDIPAQRFAWSINGVVGGNEIFGAIDSSGLFTAPSSVPSANTVKITVASVTDPNLSATAAATILNPIPSIRNVMADVSHGSLNLDIAGGNFMTGSQVQLGGQPVSTTYISKNQLHASAPVPQASTIAVMVSNPAPGAVNSAAYALSFTRLVRESRGSFSIPAARLLDQATFGPTAADIALVQQIGIPAYIDQQLTLPTTTQWPPSLNGAFLNAANNQICSNMTCAQLLWFQNAIQNPDQLRQRTAFALSQIWVISGGTIPQTDSYLPFMNILSNRAFDNYYNLMKDVTLSSSMGFYLDMGNSAKAATGQLPNENYARELLQLFTVGLYLLNDDGTYQLDSNGQPIPTYTEFDVQELARVFTGWAFQGVTTQSFPQTFTSGSTDRSKPMVFYNSGAQHDMGTKQVLCAYQPSGCSIAGQSDGNAELTIALQRVFNHPNVPPFVSKQLIEHLVTSNPSPAYVSRISQIFENNGNGVRGDLAAVVKSILLDPEARQGDAYLLQNGDGHLREPVLYVTAVLRGLGVFPVNPINYSNTANPPQFLTNFASQMSGVCSNVGQNVLFAPSVFNYFPPDYIVPGTTVTGPEFQLLTSATAPLRANFIDNVLRNGFTTSAIDVSSQIANYAAMASNPDALVDSLGQTFLHGQMTPALKSRILTAVLSIPSSNTQLNDRAKTALFLVLTSSEYQVVR